MTETAGNDTVLRTDAETWQQLDTRQWERAGEHFRWSLTWSLWRQWHLLAYREERSWSSRAFDAEYHPNGSMRPEATYDVAQGLRWADAMVALMAPILEAEARGRPA